MRYIACKYIGESKSLGRFGFIEKDSIQMLTKAEWRYVDTHGKSFELVKDEVKEAVIFELTAGKAEAVEDAVEDAAEKVVVKTEVVRSRSRTNIKVSTKKP